MAENIRTDRSQKRIARLWIRPDDPGHRLSIPAMREAAAAVRGFGADPECRAVLLEAEGEYFCAGGELGDFRKKSVEDILAFGDAFIDLHTAVVETPVPVVAKVRGHAFGGGANLIEACDLAYAGESARFAVPEITGGLAPMLAMSGLFRDLSRKQAMVMAFLGETLSAAAARDCGLVNQVFPDNKLDAGVDEVLARLVGNSPSAINLSKRLYLAIDPIDYRKRLLSGQALLVALLKSDEAREALDAADEKRKPRWKA